jgi:hypothetical protein
MTALGTAKLPLLAIGLTLAAAGLATTGGLAEAAWRPSPTTTTTTSTTTTTAAPTTTTVDPVVQYNTCRINSPWRGQAYNRVSGYNSTFSDSYRAAVINDANTVVKVCTGYPNDSALVKSAKTVLDCFAVTPPAINACYMPGNETSNYAHYLITSSA